MRQTDLADADISLTKVGNFREKLRQLNSMLVVVFGFIMPMWVAPANILAGLILVLWLIQGEYRTDLEKVRHNSFVWAILSFVLMNFVGFLWTSDLSNGWQIAGREALLLIIPLFMMVLKKEHVSAATGAFMASMLLSTVLSFLIWFKVAPDILKLESGDPVPFMGRISYAPYLTIAIYISVYYLLFASKATKPIKILASIAAASMTYILFISNGRAGQIMFFVMVGIVIFQHQKKHLARAALITLIVVPSVAAIAFMSSDRFSGRMKQIVTNIQQLDKDRNKDTPVGARITFVRNSLEIFREHPVFGVGTGDFKDEYAKVNRVNSPGMPATIHPHDMYLLEMVQFGVAGLASLLWILYAQIRIAVRSGDSFQNRFGVALPLMFAIIMFSDCYLLGHYTTMLFIYFSSILYRESSGPGDMPIKSTGTNQPGGASQRASIAS
jgi:O-antigen ligase